MNFDWATFWTSLGSSALIGLGAAYGIVQTFFKKKIEAEVESKYAAALENLNAKNQQELEGFKAGYQKVLDENQIRFSKWHEDQAEILKNTYKKLLILHQSLANFIEGCRKGNHKNVQELEKDSTTIAFRKQMAETQEFINQNSLFFSDELYNHIIKYFSEVNEYLAKANKTTNELGVNLNRIISRTKKDFRAILNGEDINSAEVKNAE